jgi:hypothetical protein
MLESGFAEPAFHRFCQQIHAMQEMSEPGNLPGTLFDIHAIERAAKGYCERLQDEPGDMSARVSLAWCCFMQALHHSGEQHVLATLSGQAAGTGAGRVESTLHSLVIDRGDRPAETGSDRAGELLKACLRQTVTVIHLSSNAEEQRDMAKLRDLVRWGGAGEYVDQAEREAVQILYALTLAILRRKED